MTAPCCVCGAPATRTVGIRPACERCAEPLRQAAVQKRDALIAAMRRMAQQHEQQEDAA